MTKYSSTIQRTMLDIVLSRKRSKPKAYRALKKKDYKQLFACHCPRMIRYKRSQGIAKAVVKHVTKDLPRLKAKQLASTIYSRMHMLPLRIGVERPHNCHTGNQKLDWYEMGIRDKYIRKELAKYMKKKGYTHRVGTKHVRSKKHKFSTIFVQTY